jgi:hypothetical protein
VLVILNVVSVIVSAAMMHEQVHQGAGQEEQEWRVAQEGQGMLPMFSQQPEEASSSDRHGGHLQEACQLGAHFILLPAFMRAAHTAKTDRILTA